MSSGVRFIYCIIISLLTGTSLCAQKYYLSHYGVTEGLASSEVNCAFQDSLGQMWIGTNDGLYLFNGISFKPIKRDIPSQYIRDMVPMKDHSLVFSHDAGLTFARPLLDSILIPDQPLSTSVKYPNRLFSDTQDRLWISQPNGELIRFDGSETTTILSEEIDKQDVMIHYSFAAVNESDFIIASPNGNIYYHKDNSSELITLGKVFDIEDILYVDNKLYIAGEGLAVAEFTDAKNSLSITWESANFNSIFTALACDKLDRIFVGTDDSGLYQLTRRQGAFQLAEVFSNNDPHRVDRLPFKHINALNITSDNSIWVCSNKGLGLLQRRFFEGTQNLPNDNATTQALADNGDIYVSMGDVYKIQKIDQEFSATKLDVPSIGAFNGLAVDRNDLWAGTNDGQVIKMDLNGQLKKVLSFSSRGAGVFRICADSENRKWFCQAPRGQPIFGLAMIDKNDQIHMYGKDKGFDNRMLVVKESPRKELYAAGIGTASYLYRYSPDQDEFINMSIPFSFPVSPNFEVHDIAIDNQGLVWLATTDGLLRHDMENIIRPDLGSYTGNEVRAVAVLPDTSIWISTDIYGMLRYKDGEILSFGEDAGLPTKIMAYRSIIADQDAKLWVNTLEGVAHTSQDLPHPFPTSTPILKSLSYNDKNLDLQRSSHSLTSGKNLAFSSISLTYPGNRTLYQYWIDRGEDTDWIDTDNPDRTLIEIDDPDIQGLKIRARKAGGHAWSDPLEIPLIVQLPWYKRKTNIFLLSILGVSLLALFWRSNNKRFRRQITDLESLLHAKNAPPDKEENKGEILYEPSAGSDPQNELLTASMHLIYTVTNHIDAGMKWDHMLEQLSIATMKLPHTVAFEIGTLRKKSNKIIIDGYAHSKQVFYNREESWSEPLSIFKHGIKAQKGEIIKGNIPNQDILSKWTGKFNSVILVPFLLGRKRYAAIAIYGDEKLQNEHVLKAIQSVANYLELIH